MKYFAYGDKMFTPRILSIVPLAKCIGVAKVMGYKLYFHSRGVDDPSGKCNIAPVKDVTSEVYGVLYEIPQNDRYLLDKAEGLSNHNQEISLKVYLVGDDSESLTMESAVAAFTYVAHKDNVFEDLVPFTWYKEMVVSGAREHHLPMDYIHHLEQYSASLDPNVNRSNKQRRYLESLIL